MDGLQKALAGLPGAVFYGAALLLITAAGALGYTAGSRAPGEGLCCHHPYCMYVTQVPIQLPACSDPTFPGGAGAMPLPWYRSAEALPFHQLECLVLGV